MAARWCVVGGGLLGLTTALRLAGEGHEVELFEAAPTIGGLAGSWELGGHRCDRHYHVILPSDRRTIGLLGELGLEGAIDWRPVRTGLYAADGSLTDATNAVAFLRRAPLRAGDKARLAATVVAALAHRDGRRLEQVGVEAWLRRWSGGRAYDTFWAPLLRAKLGDAVGEASAAFIWATLRRLLSARRSGLDAQQVGALAGGWGPALDALADRCRAAGVTIRTGTAVQHVRRAAGGAGLDVTDATCHVQRFDAAVVTLAAPAAARLCPDLDALEHDRLARVRYQGLVCVAALLEQPLGGYYLTNITDPQAPITGVVELTALTDPSQFGGRTLVYLPRYLDRDDPLYGADDATLTARFVDYLWQVFPDRRSEVVASAVSRVPEVFAVPTLRYSERMAPMVTSVPDLYLAGSAQLPFSPLNVNDTLGLVDQLLEAAAGAPAGRQLERVA
ncbi:MAG: FAD-dependent oxidoreductase [Acidimicrobiales bacterium]